MSQSTIRNPSQYLTDAEEHHPERYLACARFGGSPPTLHTIHQAHYPAHATYTHLCSSGNPCHVVWIHSQHAGGHSMRKNLPEPHHLPPQNALTMARGQALHTGRGIHSTPSQPHVHTINNILIMAQGQSLRTGHDMHPACLSRTAPMTSAFPRSRGEFPPTGQSVYSTSPEATKLPNPMSQPGNDPLLETPHQMFCPGEYLSNQGN